MEKWLSSVSDSRMVVTRMSMSKVSLFILLKKYKSTKLVVDLRQKPRQGLPLPRWKGPRITYEYARISTDARKNICRLPHNVTSGERQISPSRAASKRPTAKLSASTSSVRLPKVQTGEQSDKLVNNMPPRKKTLSRELTDSPC